MLINAIIKYIHKVGYSKCHKCKALHRSPGFKHPIRWGVNSERATRKHKTRCSRLFGMRKNCSSLSGRDLFFSLSDPSREKRRSQTACVPAESCLLPHACTGPSESKSRFPLGEDVVLLFKAFINAHWSWATAIRKGLLIRKKKHIRLRRCVWQFGKLILIIFIIMIRLLYLVVVR